MGKRVKILPLCLLLAALLCLPGCGGQSKAAAPADMQAVYAEIQKQVELPEMMQLSEKRMSSYYGIEADECAQAVLMVSEAGLRVDEIWLVEAASEDAAAHIQSVAESRIQQLCAETESYSAELYAVASAGRVLREGVQVALFISPEAETMASIFQNAVGK